MKIFVIGRTGSSRVHRPAVPIDVLDRDNVKSRLVVTMLRVPGAPLLTLVDDDELAVRKHLNSLRPMTLDPLPLALEDPCAPSEYCSEIPG
jgi:hypothetical protein